MNEDNLPSELTLEEAADMLGVSSPDLVRLMDDGALPYRGVGKNRRIPAEDVLSLQRENSDRREATRKLTEEAQKLGIDY